MEVRNLISKLGKSETNCYELDVIRIDGSALTTSSAAAGVTLGRDIVTAKDDGSNQVTIDFKEPLENVPSVFASVTASTNAAMVRITTLTVSQIVYVTLRASDASTAEADADVELLLIVPRGLNNI